MAKPRNPETEQLFEGILKLERNTVENGCILEDGSVVMSELESMEKHTPKNVSLNKEEIIRIKF